VLSAGVWVCKSSERFRPRNTCLDAIGKEKAERLCELEIRRLDALTMALAPGIQSGDVRAILAAVRVMERRAKLLGLDGPQRFAGPDGGPVAITVIHQQIEG
jgi:hypothetical protein